MTAAPDSDHVLLDAFEDLSLPSDQWTHRNHVRVAYLYATRGPFSQAVAQMRRSLQAYNAATGTPDTVDRGYHETITQAFMRLICRAVCDAGPWISSAEFCLAHPELLSKDVLQTYYSRDSLLTPTAKAEFVEPDLHPIAAIKDARWSAHLQPYLDATAIVDRGHPAIEALSAQFEQQSDTDLEYVRLAFEWVRDQIRHSVDFDCTEVTCRASEVLAAKTGFCYAKSHLLAALLRARNIPTGFCYQRLSVGEVGPPWCLHGLNAVLLPQWGWYRIDPRGNKTGVQAEFTPPVEQLAFSAIDPAETDLPRIYSRPLKVVVDALQTAPSVRHLMASLPDLSR